MCQKILNFFYFLWSFLLRLFENRFDVIDKQTIEAVHVIPLRQKTPAVLYGERGNSMTI